MNLWVSFLRLFFSFFFAYFSLSCPLLIPTLTFLTSFFPLQALSTDRGICTLRSSLLTSSLHSFQSFFWLIIRRWQLNAKSIVKQLPLALYLPGICLILQWYKTGGAFWTPDFWNPSKFVTKNKKIKIGRSFLIILKFVQAQNISSCGAFTLKPYCPLFFLFP